MLQGHVFLKGVNTEFWKRSDEQSFYTVWDNSLQRAVMEIREQFLADPQGPQKKFERAGGRHQNRGKVYKKPWLPNQPTMSVNCPTTIVTDVFTL